jgi:glucose/arabinose dehydrogenase
LREVMSGPDGALYVSTSNRDGRGRVREKDDRILRISEQQ